MWQEGRRQMWQEGRRQIKTPGRLSCGPPGAVGCYAAAMYAGAGTATPRDRRVSHTGTGWTDRSARGFGVCRVFAGRLAARAPVIW
jgi:hypothetical protein